MSKSDEPERLQAEVQKFRAPAGVQRLLLSAFFLIISSVPVLQSATELWKGEVPVFLEVFTQRPTRTQLRAYEKDLERSSFLVEGARPFVYSVWHGLFHYAGEKVIIGREGWLFYRQDVDYLLGRSDSAGPMVREDKSASSAEDPVSTIVDFRNQLAKRGIRLIVMPVPGKPSIYPESVTWRFQGQVTSPTRKVIRELREQGVEVIDLFPVFQQWRRTQGNQMPLYLRLDTHWSAATARATGELVAHRINELGWLNLGKSSLQLQALSISRPGDLVHMIPLPNISSVYPAERVDAFQVWDTGSRTLYRDDPAASVLVLGDSFSRIYQSDAPRAAGFIAHLARGLRTPVASIVNDGGASTLVRQQLKRNPTLLKRKKVVVWEFVERDISFGTEGWQTVELDE